MRTTHRIMTWALVLVPILGGTTWAELPSAQLGDKAPPLEGLEWVKGEATTLGQGSVRVVEFWATWCGPCIQGMPHLTKLQQAYADRGVVLIGVSKEAAGVVRPFVEKQGEKMGYTVAIDTTEKVWNGYMKAFQQGGIPHAFIVDGDGRIAWRGHPMTMDGPLEQIVAGTYDLAAEKTRMEEAKREQEAAQEAFRQKREALEKRVDEMTRKIDGDPDNAALYARRAEIRLGDSFTTDLAYRPLDVKNALADYQKAVELDPDGQAGVADHVAFLAAWEAQSAEGIAPLAAFAEQYPDSIHLPFAMYILYYHAQKEGDIKQALEYVTVADRANLDGRFGEFVRQVRNDLEEKLAAGPEE